MTNYKLDPIFQIRKYLWEKMLEDGIFNIEDYYSDNLGQEIVPILPVQQSTELSHFLSGKKHMVYDKIGMSFEDNWVITCEQVLFTMYSTEVIDIVEMRNYISDTFRRMDESAREINQWDQDGIFKFHSIFIADISPTAPSEELQGFLSSDIILEIKYSRNVTPDGRYV
jgi:hypothetical protein